MIRGDETSMRHQLAQQEQRRQNTLLLSLAVAVVASLAFSDFLTRTDLGVASFWPANGLLVVGLMALNAPRRIALDARAATAPMDRF